MKVFLFFLIFLIDFVCGLSGYAVTLNDNQNNSIVIPKVIIEAPLAAKSKIPTNSQITVITQQQIKESGAANISEILQGQGGIQLQDLTGDGSQVAVSMRGFGANASQNTLILLDGVPLNNPDIGVPDINSIPVDQIEKIEIVQGSEGVLFGEQAVGGVINIITKKPTHHRAYVQTRYGSYNQKDIYANVSDFLKNGFGYQISAQKTHTDNYRDHNNDDQENVHGDVNYQYNSGALALDYYFNHERLLYAGALTLAQLLQNRRQAQNYTDFSNLSSHFIHFKHKQNLDQNWRLETNISDRDDDGHGFLSAPFQQFRGVTIVSPQLTGLINTGLINNVLLTTGVEGIFDRYRLKGTFAQSNDNQNRQSIYIHAKMPFTQCLTGFVGTRAAQMRNQLESLKAPIQSTYNSAIVSTVGLSYKINRFFNVYIRRDGNYRFPKADENSFTPIDVVGLKTQKGVSYETGANLTYKRWQAALNLYQINLTNEIAYDPTQTPTQPFGANRNLDPTRHRGLIFSSNYALTKFLIVGGQYSFVDARFLKGIFAGNEIPFVARNMFHLTSDHFVTKHFDIFAEAVFTGKRFPIGDDANIAPKEPGFTVYNMNFRYHYKKFNASFRINNITNNRYNLISSIQQITNTDFTQAFYPAPGRNFLLTIGFEFV